MRLAKNAYRQKQPITTAMGAPAHEPRTKRGTVINANDQLIVRRLPHVSNSRKAGMQPRRNSALINIGVESECDQELRADAEQVSIEQWPTAAGHGQFTVESADRSFLDRV